MATMQQVADRAGVSIATVSFVVNGNKRVSEETRARVSAAMRELGYRNNVVARALASRRTRILALLFPVLEQRLGQTALQFFTSAASRASELGYHLVLWPAATTADDVRDLISGGLADGVVVMEVTMHDPRIERLVEMDVPFVSIGRTADPSSISFVDIDFERTVEDALDHLAGLGHRRIGLVVEDLDGTAMAEYGPKVRSEAAFRSSMARRGLDGTVVASGASAEGGRAAARELLERDPGVTAAIIMKDDSNFGLVSGLTAAGKRVPEDVSVIAIVSSDGAGAATEPVLTTLNAPGPELGRLAVESLVDRLEGATTDLTHTLIPCAMHLADSTGPARA
ncbi:LacI family DNA-binding transcriptional regulator [Curtobacterium sp. PhB115]|uniref:LacI family DNA-binding transcriptional regulator n=1 Tax=Curtobacterium sp. PhB115 TaxID=2485173 RepID=UPI000F99430F|nr:LacI family DNA-binding transcriptional regulator [Curtobacterium sp. PhB115]ROP74543.1 LacI family transcriptional regulator [Curtobacterium sp. PhB115]